MLTPEWLRAGMLTALFLLAACQPKRPLPDLPAVALEDAQPAVRSVIEAALFAARAKPQDASAVAQLGMALDAHRQFAGATQAYERATLLDSTQPDYPYYWGSALASDGRYTEAVPPLRTALRLRDSLPVRLRLGEALYAAGLTAQARIEYEAAILANPNLAAAHFGLGLCLTGVEAIASFNRAIELYPRYGAARFALAGVYRQTGQRAEAEALLVNYERDKLLAPPIDDPAMAAIQALDASANGLLRRAQAAERQGQLAEALSLQKRALAADPKLAQAWVNLVSLHGRLGQPEEAEAAYRRAVALEPKNAEAHYNFGVLCAQANRRDEARQAFAAAVAADPGNAMALDNWGAIVEQQGPGAWALARQLYQRAIAADPGLRLAHYHLGRSYANQGRYREAIAALEKSVETVDEQTPGFRYALGATYARAGERARAVQILDRARQEALQWQQSALASTITGDLAVLQP